MAISEKDLERTAKLLGKRIQALRKAAGMTQVELEQKADVYDIGAVERGEKNPTLLTLLRVASALELGLGRLFEGLDSRTLSASDRLKMELLGLLEGEGAGLQRKALKMVRLLLK